MAQSDVKGTALASFNRVLNNVCQIHLEAARVAPRDNEFAPDGSDDASIQAAFDNATSPHTNLEVDVAMNGVVTAPR